MVSPQGFYWFIHYLFLIVASVFWASTVSSSVLLRHYTFSPWFSLFHYLFVTSVLCSRLRQSLLLFVTSLLSLHGFHCFIICLLRYCLFFCLLRHYAFCSWFPLFHYLFVTSVLCSRASTVSSSVCYVTMLSLQGIHCFIICLLRLSLPLYVTSLFIVSMSEAPLQTNYYSEALQTQYTDVSEFEAEASQATASEGLAQGPYFSAKRCPRPFRRKVSNLPISHHTPLSYLFKVFIVLLSVHYITALF